MWPAANKFSDRMCRQQADGVAGASTRPKSLLSAINQIAVGKNNVDMTLNEFLLHAKTDQQEYLKKRFGEYAAMLHMVGLLTGFTGTPDEQKSAQEALVAAIKNYLASLDNQQIEWMKEHGPHDLLSGIVANVQDVFGYEEAAKATRRAGRLVVAQETEVRLRIATVILDVVRSIVNDLVKWWHDFWRVFEEEGLLIAINRLRIDVSFLAAECALDIAIGAVTAGAGAVALRALRVTGKVIGSKLIRVTVKGLRPNGMDTPDLMKLDLPEDKIDPNIQAKIFDEDKLGSGSTLKDTSDRTTPKPSTGESTSVKGDTSGKPRPPTSGKKLTAAERAKLRSATPTRALRQQVNLGQPDATTATPVPDHWLPGLKRTAPLEPDHIVPVDRIFDMDGFSDLPKADQLDILNLKENFHGLSRAANASRSNKSFDDWIMHQTSSTPVDPILRAQMIPREAELTEKIQQLIYDRLRKRQSEGVVPTVFRSD